MPTTNTQQMFIIYLITNIINGKVYVGKTSKTVDERFNMHKRLLKNGNHPNKHMIGAYNKYGNDAFTIESLMETPVEKVANSLERLWIFIFASFDPRYGYNKTYGGDGQYPTQETLNKMTGRPCPIEVREKISLAQRGRPLSEEHKRKLCGPRPHTLGNLGPVRKDVSTDEIIKLYNSGLSIRDVAKNVGMVHEGVRKRLIKNGIDRRLPHS